MAPTVELPLPDSIKAVEKSKVQLEIRADSIRIKGIPKNHTLEFLAKEKHGANFYVIHRHKKKKGYGSIGLHIGHESCLREANVKNSYRNSICIIAEYSLDNKPGKLSFPLDYKKGPAPIDVHNGCLKKLESLIAKPYTPILKKEILPLTKHI